MNSVFLRPCAGWLLAAWSFVRAVSVVPVVSFKCVVLLLVFSPSAALAGGVVGDGDAPALAVMDGGEVGNAAARSVVSLDGAWDFVVDPYDTGMLDYKSRPLKAGFWVDRRPSGPRDLVEYDFGASAKLVVPGDWNTQSAELFLYEGAAWYRRVFEVDLRPGSRQWIRLEGANQRSMVWLNGSALGENRVGFTPRTYEATGVLRQGSNTLIVRVDNRRDGASVPGLLTDWWNYGGITRRVDVLETPAVFVRDAHAELSADRTRVDGWVALAGAGSGGLGVLVSIGDASVEVRTDAAGVARWSVSRGEMALWSPGSPVLHDLRVEVLGGEAGRERAGGGDVFRERVGLRTIAAVDGRVLLNGEAIGLRGVCVHEEQIAGDGRSWSEAHARELASRLKELGCNFVRLAHYPHAEIVSRVMDEAGIMVWAEIPVYWKLDYANEKTLAEAMAHLDGLIGRDHNRASVVVWSIGNETEVTDASTAFRNALAARVRTLDPGRLLAAALEASLTVEEGRVVRMAIKDPFAEQVDLLAINSYIGWYVGNIEDMKSLPVELGYNKPFMISEFGADAKRGREPADDAVDEIWTEAYQAKLYEATLDWMETTPNFAGCAPWILSDFRSPRRLLPGVQDYWNRKGLLDEAGREKAAFGLLRERYGRWEKAWPRGD